MTDSVGYTQRSKANFPASSRVIVIYLDIHNPYYN